MHHSDVYEPSPDELDMYAQIEYRASLSPHQRDTYVRLQENRQRQEAWAEQNRDWITDHMELWDKE